MKSPLRTFVRAGLFVAFGSLDVVCLNLWELPPTKRSGVRDGGDHVDDQATGI
jgi:hypothetical protein